MIDYWPTIFLIFRLGITALFVLYVPGYALSYWLFPRHALNYLERLFVALATSIILSSLVGFGLLRLFGTEQRVNFVLAIAALTLIFGIGAFWRAQWRQTGSVNRSQSTPSSFKPGYYLAISLALVLLVVVAITGASLVYQAPTAGLVEFYIPPQNLPNLLKNPINQQGSLAIPIGITNRAQEPVTCRIEAKVDGQKLWELPGVVVNSGSTWQETITIPWANSKKPSFVELNLFSNFSNTPATQLRLWLESNPTEK